MNRTFIALLIKLLGYFILSWLILGGMIFTNNIGSVLLVALLAAVINYLVGDLFILPRFGNIIACITDGFMAALTAIVYSYLYRGFRTTFSSMITFAVLIAIGEFFFHRYLGNSKKVAP